MPISRGEFNQRRIDLTLPIVDLLERYPNAAFTAEEEVRQLLAETHGRGSPLEEVEGALETLVLQQRVEKAEIEGHRWYTIVEREERRLGFLR